MLWTVLRQYTGFSSVLKTFTHPNKKKTKHQTLFSGLEESSQMKLLRYFWFHFEMSRLLASLQYNVAEGILFVVQKTSRKKSSSSNICFYTNTDFMMII